MVPRPSRFSPFFLFVALLAPASVHGQTTAVATTEENVRATPNGTRIARVPEGSRLRVLEQQDNWRAAVLDGWIWAASVRDDNRDGHDLVVSASNGENLRAEPNGTIVARLRPGTLLTQIAQEDRWVRVQRQGWIWEQSIRIERTAASDASGSDDASTSPDPGNARAGTAGGQLLSSPASDTIAQIHPLAQLEVLATEGNWAHVRLKGWIWAPSLAGPSDDHDSVTELSTADLADNPDRYRGLVTEWDVQFIALERAEAIRTDFYEGEPYMLARGPRDEPGFVYVGIPADHVNDVSRTPPLQRIRIRARVRNGWSTLLDAPVLDLLEIVETDR